MSLTACNRRRAPRTTEQMAFTYESEGKTRKGNTINLSDTGARLVMNAKMPIRFRVTLQSLDGPIKMDAVKVWEQTLGETRIVGVRFAN